MFGVAEREILIHTTIDDFEDKSRVLLSILRNLDQEKIKLKISLSGDSHRIKRFASRNDLKIKESEQNGKYFIIDKKELLLMIHPESADEEVGVWVNSPYFANSFTGMLDKLVK